VLTFRQLVLLLVWTATPIATVASLWWEANSPDRQARRAARNALEEQTR
jgi:hypothetical protein